MALKHLPTIADVSIAPPTGVLSVIARPLTWVDLEPVALDRVQRLASNADTDKACFAVRDETALCNAFAPREVKT